MRRWLVVLVLVVGCKKEPARSGASSAEPARRPAPSVETVTLRVAYGSEKKTWLEEQARAFEAGKARTRSGRAIQIAGEAMGSGEAMRAVATGKLQPHVFSPASSVYVPLLNQEWLSTGGHTRPLAPAGEPLVLSPVVIAMWKPMAEALGWPDKRLGWKDLLKVNAGDRGWGAHGHGEWGAFKLGHTHPEYSNSGFLAVLAVAYAGAQKTRGLSPEDVDAKATQDLLTAVERTIVHYGKSTGFFADKMIERGPEYLSAAVLYENLVIESYARSASPPLVAVYPVEGTFWSDHPYSILDAEWVGPEEREAAEAFLAFLRARPAQERALALGFRPADPSIAVGAPIDAAHGADPKQPQTLLEIPDAATLARLLEAWRKTKKTTDVILVFDKSGSMRGAPLAQAKAGAKAFLETLHDTDDVTLLFFDSKVAPAVGPLALGKHRAALIQRIDGVLADGGTALYQAVSEAHQEARRRAAKERGRIHAVVVMTDGLDTDSKIALDALSKRLAEEADVRVFTIAYGSQADAKILKGIAEAGKGASATGNVETIGQVFADMGTFF